MEASRSEAVVSPTLPVAGSEPAEPEGTMHLPDSPPKLIEGSEDPLSAASVLTPNMLSEEQKMEEETQAKQQLLCKEHEQSRDLTEEGRQQRYKRLQFLLSKSNMYTEYLINRMASQAELEKKKEERRQKRKENQLEKEKNTPTEVRSSGRNAKQDNQEPSLAKRKRSTTAVEKKEPKRKRRRRNSDASSEDTDETSAASQNSAASTDSERNTETSEGVSAAVNKSGNKTKEQQEKDTVETEGEASAERDFKVGLDENKEQPELLVGGTLRPYQMEGFRWLQVLYENGVNGILADEMGLGKTIQCIAAIADMCAHGVPGPYLVVAPLSVVPNWVSEFKRFAPAVPVMLYHGTKDDRAHLRRKIKRSTEVKPGVKVQPVVVTSYEVAMNDRAALGIFPWKYLIVDEGHRIKNAQCRLIKELKMYSSTHRLLLTGTPLQNNLAELWSLLNFLLPEIFDDLASFEAWFDLSDLDNAASREAIVAEEQRDNILATFHQILKPFMLRRMKCDVELNIPPKCEVIVYAPLTTYQTSLYNGALENTIEDMLKGSEEKVNEKDLGRGKRKKKGMDYRSMFSSEDDEIPKVKTKEDEDDLMAWCDSFVINEPKLAADKLKKTKGNGKTEVNLQIRNKMMLLRKICNHPYLIEYPLKEDGEYRVDEALITQCGKMMLLDQMLTELRKQGHKVLVFSQMTSMLDIIGDYLYYRGLNFSRLDGSMQFTDRVKQIDQFTRDADVGVFLLSTRAGGLGLNLVAADTVIIYDSDWNPQADLQAQDRCHRIGQTTPVMIYRLVTGHTIDQRIVERAAAKRKLEKLVIIKGKFKKGLQSFDTKMSKLSPDELRELLESSDFHEKVEIQKKRGRNQAISQKDLQKLLDRSHLYRQWKNKTKSKSGESPEEGEEREAEEEEEREAEEEEEREVEGVFKTLDTTVY